MVAEHVVRAGRLLGEQPTGDSTMPRDGDPQVEYVATVPEHAVELLAGVERIAQLGVWRIDLEAGTAYFSEGMREMCDIPPDGTVSDAIRLAFADDQAVLESFQARLASAADAQPTEIEVRNGTGDQIFLVRALPEFDAAGALVRATGTVQDVTRFRVAEQRAGQDRRLFVDAQRVARMGTWEWNTGTGECIWSSMLYELFGVEPGTPITYTDYLSLVHPEDRSWVDERWQDLARTGRPVECEHRAVLPDGMRKVFRCRGAALDTEHGGPVMIGTAQDVTEQRSTETRMMRSSQRFSDLVAIAPVGIGLFDESERLVDANDALCRLLQMDLERLRGTPAVELTHSTDRGESLFSGSPRRSGDTRASQRVLVTAAGKAVYCELNVTVSVADDGQRFWLVVFSDVTERRRAAERLKYQATHDELTGLPGRAAVNDLLGQLLGGPDADRVALLFCDVDNFKRVNDSLGHDVGDELITALARRLERGLPPSCTAGRMSGDEYVVICSDVSEVGGVETLANRVAQLLRAAVPVHGQLLRVSATIGAATPPARRPRPRTYSGSPTPRCSTRNARARAGSSSRARR